MRTIKFRVWEHHNNKFTNNPIGFRLNNNFELSIPNDSFDGEIWKFTYQQYTGLKDKNGKEIYEGDILDTKLSKSNENTICVVVYSIDRGGYRLTFPLNTVPPQTVFLQLNCITSVESIVIGNIFENSDLLKNDE